MAPVDCFLNNSRVLTIASAFGFAIFALVYVSASFSGASRAPLWFPFRNAHSSSVTHDRLFAATDFIQISLR